MVHGSRCFEVWERAVTLSRLTKSLSDFEICGGVRKIRGEVTKSKSLSHHLSHFALRFRAEPKRATAMSTGSVACPLGRCSVRPVVPEVEAALARDLAWRFCVAAQRPGRSHRGGGDEDMVTDMEYP